MPTCCKLIRRCSRLSSPGQAKIVSRTPRRSSSARARCSSRTLEISAAPWTMHSPKDRTRRSWLRSPVRMGYLAYGHPFLDGNGRTIMVIHAELARRAGFGIDWSATDKDRYLAALTQEIDTPGQGV